MSGVYINGMEMPIIEMEWTIRHGADGKWYAIDTNAETSDGEWHEIIPVPSHGRLIDADALEANIWKMRARYQMLDDTQIADKIMHGMYLTERAVKDAPTIIQTSGGKENVR